MKIQNKFALVIAINYFDTNSELYGCINDGINITNFIKSKFKYLSQNIIFLNDRKNNTNQPTKNNIIKNLNDIINKINNINGESELWLSFSGHGTQVSDHNYDEISDNYDEVIVPSDYMTSGFITDDTLYSTLKKINNSRCKVMALFDCCNSGTILDLNKKYVNNNYSKIENKNPSLKCKIFMISGCKDNQTSADYFDHQSNKYGGALTNSFLKFTKPSNGITFIDLINKMRGHLRKSRFTQIPQITTNSVLNKRTYIFKKNGSEINLLFQQNRPKISLLEQRRRRRRRRRIMLRRRRRRMMMLRRRRRRMMLRRRRRRRRRRRELIIKQLLKKFRRIN